MSIGVVTAVEPSDSSEGRVNSEPVKVVGDDLQCLKNDITMTAEQLDRSEIAGQELNPSLISVHSLFSNLYQSTDHLEWLRTWSRPRLKGIMAT